MIEKIAQEWELRGYSCDVWEDPKGQCWEDYVHDVDELLMVIKGEVELEIGGKKCHPDINEVVHIPANTIHSVRNIGSETACFLYGYKTHNVNEKDISNFNK